MKSTTVVKFSILIGLLMLPSSSWVRSDDMGPSGGVTVNGFTYNIAQDRKIENIGGLNEPEGLDKYMKRRFDSLDQKISSLSKQMDDLGQQLKDLGDAIQKNKGSGEGLVV